MFIVKEGYNYDLIRKYFGVRLIKKASETIKGAFDEIQSKLGKIPFLSKFKRNINYVDGDIDNETFCCIYYFSLLLIHRRGKKRHFLADIASEREYLENKNVYTIIQWLVLGTGFYIETTKYTWTPLIGNTIDLYGIKETIDKLSEYFEKKSILVF
ncbi:MAG: hypothetical protein RMJ67_01060 [Elusimicrobiota bacterium]|nr:hypothetical protein [Endomicrobiia bacterium]MDW8165092.1 hypothetical protein [Elusimicrobiota bacterium]